jgi:type 1 glutamine amidotransferase
MTRSAGFKHAVVPFAADTMKKLAEQERDFDVTVTDDPSVISTEGLKNYNALLFYTTGKTTAAFGIDEQQKQALMDFVKSGKGFAGVHSATDTFYDWPEYGEMIGGFFDEHPWHQEVTIKVEDTKHPATRHLGTSFKINDEIYQFKDFSRSRVHVLLSLDTSSVDLTKKNVKRTDGDFATSWVRDWAKGRVFYTALGHEQAVWSDPRFQTHLLNGIRWTMRTIK